MMTDNEDEIWNAALAEAIKAVKDERGSRSEFSDGSSEGWDAACDWIETRIESFRR